MLAHRNLLKNAADYSSAGGRVHVRMAPRLDRFVLGIPDEGAGVADEEIERLKAPSVRGARTVGTGSGLRLSIVEIGASQANADLLIGIATGGGLEAALSFDPSASAGRELWIAATMGAAIV